MTGSEPPGRGDWVPPGQDPDGDHDERQAQPLRSLTPSAEDAREATSAGPYWPASPAAAVAPPVVPAATAPVPLDLPRRTSPLSIAYEMLAVLAGVAFLVGTVDQDWLLGFSLASSVAGLVALVLTWRFRTYTLTRERLLLDEGVLRRRNRVVPFARVQQVNVNQELLHRPFGLAALQVETAGEGGSSSVSLRVLRRDDAEALRAYVLARRSELAQLGDTGSADQGTAAPPGDQGSPGVVPFVAERPLGAMQPRDLVLAGVTHSVVLAAVGAYMVVATPWIVILFAGDAAGSLPAAGLTLAVLLGGSILVALVIALFPMISSLMNDWNWTLSDHGDDLHVRRGLLEVRSQSMPRGRVQQVTIVDNPVRRFLGVAAVALHTAAVPGSQQATMVQVPLVRRSELDDFLAALMGPAWVLPELQPRTERARWRALRRRALLLLALFGAPVVVWPNELWVMSLLVLLAWPWGQAAHRRAGLGLTEGRVVFASGVLHHRIDIAPRDRLQSTRVGTSPLQRRAGLATIHADLAGTTWRGPLRMSARLFDVDAQVADDLRRGLPLSAS